MSITNSYFIVLGIADCFEVDILGERQLHPKERENESCRVSELS